MSVFNSEERNLFRLLSVKAQLVVKVQVLVWGTSRSFYWKSYSLCVLAYNLVNGRWRLGLEAAPWRLSDRLAGAQCRTFLWNGGPRQRGFAGLWRDRPAAQGSDAGTRGVCLDEGANRCARKTSQLLALETGHVDRCHLRAFSQHHEIASLCLIQASQPLYKVQVLSPYKVVNLSTTPHFTVIRTRPKPQVCPWGHWLCRGWGDVRLAHVRRQMPSTGLA